MNEKEKAVELVEKFTRYTPVEFELEYAKQCALICCDEALNSLKVPQNVNFKDEEYEWYKATWEYYEKVKTEIEKM